MQAGETDSADHLVSVIVPVYNAAGFLRRCVDSALNQTHRKTEVVLVDDGSTDGSGMICDEYAGKDPRVRAIHKKNGGPSEARNLGIDAASGGYILFLDADDYLQENAIKSLVGCCERNGAEIAIGDFRMVKNGIEQRRGDISFTESVEFNEADLLEYARKYLKKPNKHLLFAYSWGRLFKSALIKGRVRYNTSLHTFEDVAFNFQCLKDVKKAYFLKEIVYNHTTYDNFSSATMSMGDNPNKLLGYGTALDEIGKFLEGKVDNNDIEREVGHAYVTLTIIQLVRICGQINNNNGGEITALARGIISETRLRKSLRHYAPEGTDSKILPLLMRMRLIPPIIWVCRHKAQKRYKGGEKR